MIPNLWLLCCFSLTPLVSFIYLCMHWSICLLPQKLIVTGWWDISASWKGSLFVTIFTGICCLSTSYPFRVFKCNLIRLRVFNVTEAWSDYVWVLDSSNFLFSPRNLAKMFTHFWLAQIFPRGWFNHQLDARRLLYGCIEEKVLKHPAALKRR